MNLENEALIKMAVFHVNDWRFIW